MKFRVERDPLADAVAWAARSLPVRPSVPVLAGLLIEAGNEGLVLSTFDYETSARATLSAEIADEGVALVSGRLLADICRSLPNKPVEMVIDGSRVSYQLSTEETLSFGTSATVASNWALNSGSVARRSSLE